MYNWPQKPFILAHRGARSLAPENTLKAFQKAFELGADGFECDVFLSQDAVPVILHDETLERTTSGHGLVWEHTAQALEILGVPTLEQSLDIIPNQGIINIELKGCAPYSALELYDRIDDLLKKRQNQIQVIISSFDPKLLEAFHKYPLGLLFEADQVIEIPVSLQPNALNVDYSCLSKVPTSYKTILWTAKDVSQARLWLAQGVDGVIAEF